MPGDTYAGDSSADDGAAQPTRERPYGDVRHEAPVTYTAAPERHQPPRHVRWIAGALVAFMALVLICGGATAALGAIVSNSTPATATVDKALSVGGVPTLMIHSPAGSVHINAGGAGRIALHAELQARGVTYAQAQNEVNAIHVTTTQTGDVVSILVELTNRLVFSAFDVRRIDLTVTAPASTNLSIVEDAGSLDASGFTGKLAARVNAGDATLSDMTMAKGSSLRVNAGSLRVDGALQPDATLLVVVNAGSADVTLPQNTSAHLDANATAGSVHVNGWNIVESGNAGSMTASGDLNPNPTGAITIHVNAGSATLSAA
jgi:hypothetical protein